MSGPGKQKTQLGVTVSSAQADYITARGAKLDWSQSKTLKAVVEFWLAMGAPPLTEPDAKSTPVPMPAEIRVVPLDCWHPYLAKASVPTGLHRSRS